MGHLSITSYKILFKDTKKSDIYLLYKNNYTTKSFVPFVIILCILITALFELTPLFLSVISRLLTIFLPSYDFLYYIDSTIPIRYAP